MEAESQKIDKFITKKQKKYGAAPYRNRTVIMLFQRLLCCCSRRTVYINNLAKSIKCNALSRATFYAVAAADALGLIHISHKVFDMNGVMLTGLLTLHTTDATNLALLAYLGALVVALAAYNGFLAIQRCQINDALRASVNAHFAGFATQGVYFSNTTVIDVNGIVRTNVDTVAVTEAAVRTGLAAGIQLRSGFAGKNTCVIHHLFCIFMGAVTKNNGSLRYTFSSRNTQNFGNAVNGILSTRGAEGAVGAGAFGKGRCVTGATGEAASTAVGAGQHFFNGYGSLIYRNRHNNGGNCQH